MKSPTAPTARPVARTVLASSIASLLLAGLAHAVTWSGSQPLTLGVDPGGDDVDLLADTVVTLQGTGGTLVENVIFNASAGAVTTLTVNNAAGATRALAANATVLGVANGRVLQVAGTADFRLGGVSDGGFANVQLVKNGGSGELILDNAANDLDGATLRVVDGTMSIFGFGGSASAVDTLVNAIRIDGVNAKLRLGTLTAPGTTFANNLAVNDSGTLEHTAASDDTLSGAVALASGKTLTANVTDGTLRHSGVFSRGANSGLTKTGAGTMVLAGFGTGSGVTNINGGTLQYAVPGALYSGATASWTAANINVASGATLALNVGGASDFSTANVTTLLTQISTVNNNGLKAGASFGFDTTNATATVSYSSALTNSSGTGGGNVGFKKLGAGTLSLSGTNSYTGVTSVNTGTLQFAKLASLYGGAAASWIPANLVVASGSTLALNVGGTNEFGTGDVDTLLNGSHLGASTVSTGLKSGAILGFDTTTASGGTFTYITAISNPNAGANALHLTKLGTGTLSLGGVNTHTGATTISAGTLALASGGSINNSSGISIASAATYNVSAVVGYNLAQTLSAKGTGTANVTGAVNAGARTLDLQDGSNTGTLAFSNSLTLSGATLKFDLGAVSSDRITIGGGITLGGANIINAAPLTGAPGLATGIHAYTLLTAGSGLVSSSFSLSNPVITIGATTYLLTLSGDATHQYLDVVTGSPATPTTYTLTTAASLHSIRIGTGTTTITTTITNTGTTGAFRDSLSYASLGGIVAPGAGVTLGAPGSGASVAANASGTANNVANQTFSSTVAGSYLITASGGAVTNTTVGGAPTLQGGVGTDTVNVYRFAAPNTIATPVTFAGNRHVGDVVTEQALTLNNTAAADGFSEKLDALILGTTGGVTGTGAVTLLAAGVRNSSSLLVGLDTSTVGAKGGTVTVGLTSNGAGTSFLGTTALASQVITVNAGTVYRLAEPGVIDSLLVFSGNYHVGDVVGAQTLVVSNEADADGFSEKLNAVFTGTTGGVTGSGTASLVAAGNNNTTALLVGLNTSTVGTKSGTVTVGLTSNGAGTSLLGTTVLASQVITVSAGSVYRLAAGAVGGPVNFLGNYHVGDAVTAQALSITNVAAADGYSETLNATFASVAGGATGTGTLSLLAAGGTNASNLLVGLDTSTVGAKAGTVTVGLTSNGAGTSLLGTTALASQVITVNAGSVYRLAAPSMIGSPVIFAGNRHVGDIVAPLALSLANGAAADGFSEKLDAIFSGSTGGVLGMGVISLLSPGATDASALLVNLDTSTVGAKSGTVTVGLTSNGAATSLLGTTTLASQVITVSAGSVFRLAAPSGINSALTFVGNYHLGDAVTPQALSLTNAAAGDGFSESLEASFTGNAGGGTGTGAISLLAAGAINSTSLLVGLDTSTVGAKTGTVTVGFASSGEGTSLLGTTALSAQVIPVNAGSVFRLAAPSPIISPLIFNGNRHVGDVVAPQALILANVATTDGFSEELDATFVASTGGVSGAGSISLLAAGVGNFSNLLVSMNTSTAGPKSGSVTVGLMSNGAGTSALGTTGLAPQVITVTTGSVFRLAVPRAIDSPVMFLGNHHVGDVVPTQTLVLANEAPGDPYSEELDAAFVGTTGGATGIGTIVQLAANEDNDTNLLVGIDTSTVGAKSGTVTVGLTSNGAGTSLLGTTALAPQVITVSAGSVYRLAAGAVGGPVTFLGNYRVGDAVTAQALSLTNAATGDGFSEKLDAAFVGSTGGATGSWTVGLLAAGGTDLSGLLVGLDTSTVGAKSGTVTVGLTSNGAGTSLLGTTALASQVITVNAGSVYRLAVGALGGLVTFLGNYHVGDAVTAQALSLTNAAAGDGFSETLDAAFVGSTGGATGSGTVGLLAAGGTDLSGLSVGLDTSTVGAKSGTVTVGLTSNGAGTSLLGTTGLASQVMTVNAGSVYRLAAAGAINNMVTLPNIHVGESFGTSAIAITNTAASDGFSEGLNAVTANLTGDASATGGVTNGIGSSSAISVGLGNASTVTAGVKTGTVDVVVASSGSNSGLADTALGLQTVAVSGVVYRLAAASGIGSPVNLGRVRVGGTFGSVALEVSNSAVAGAFTEGLNAGFGGNTGAATHNNGSIANLAGGATNGAGLVVGLGGATNTGVPGAVTGTVTVDFVSNGTVSGLADTNLTSQIVNVAGFVYSGVGVWSVEGGGNWATIGNWQASGGVPGLDAGFAATDTVTFGSGATSAEVVVSLAGVNPSVKAIAFNNATHSYAINNTGGGTLKLDNGADVATVTNSGGTHVIGSAVELNSNTMVAVSGATDVLSLTGGISQTGSRSLTKTGVGTLNLVGPQGYDTLIASDGTTNIDGPLGAAPGTAAVVANASIRFGSVSQTLASLSIGAGATVTFSSGAASLRGFGGKAAAVGGSGAGSAVVPEPSALGLLLMGALGIGGLRRRGIRR